VINLTTVNHAYPTFMFVNESGFFFFQTQSFSEVSERVGIRRNQSWFVYQIGKFV
jgi:hypothetical protein